MARMNVTRMIGNEKKTTPMIAQFSPMPLSLHTHEIAIAEAADASQKRRLIAARIFRLLLIIPSTKRITQTTA